MPRLDPATLPIVDVVEIYYIDGNWLSEVKLQEVPSVQLTGTDAERIAAIWRALPPGEGSRCHIPPFALSFIAEGELVYEASICWRCNNIHGRNGTTGLFFEFDASQPISRALLRECEAATGISAIDDSAEA